MNKKFANLGTALSRDEAKKVMGGWDNSLDPGNSTCTSTCWSAPTEGNELGSVTVPNCDGANADKYKDDYPSAPKATCFCA
ncbi:MAG: hypothetical protein MUE72_05455 [Chitinophagaceae bacterium]|nr:hypothetical protein [Chitinophagaceae bacterium]